MGILEFLGIRSPKEPEDFAELRKWSENKTIPLDEVRPYLIALDEEIKKRKGIFEEFLQKPHNEDIGMSEQSQAIKKTLELAAYRISRILGNDRPVAGFFLSDIRRYLEVYNRLCSIVLGHDRRFLDTLPISAKDIAQRI